MPGGQVCLLPIIKHVSSLRSAFLFCNAAQRAHLCHSVILGGKGDCCKYTVLDIGCLLQIIKFFVSDSVRVSLVSSATIPKTVAG